MSEQPPQGELEYRAASQVGVSFPDRTIELIVMPYEQETTVEYRGRLVTEIVSRGAFNGVQRRKVKANRDHDITRIVGHCAGLHPNRDEGLVAEVVVSDTPLGDETLTLANDGLLDASAGFMPLGPDGEQWEGRSRRRIQKAFLAHVAFVPEPAYQGARVLSVRAQSLPEPPGAITTPNLDVVRAWIVGFKYSPP